jgi:signal transduction histidine kinase
MGRAPRLWPMLFLLLIVVMLPTACLLWMMGKAIDNERLAVRQVLAETCRSHLTRLQNALDDHWRAKDEGLDFVFAVERPQCRFRWLPLVSHLVDSAVICDDQHHPIYPTVATLPVEQPTDPPAWVKASELESRAGKNAPELLKAAEAYAALTKEADANIAARAIVAQARCLTKAGRTQDAINLLGSLNDERFEKAVDHAGRLIIIDAELRALELLGSQSTPQSQELTEDLARRLIIYGDPRLGSSQRLFAMKRLVQLQPSVAKKLCTLPAEELATEFLELGVPLTDKPIVRPAGLPNVWQFASPDGRVVALLRTKRIEEEFQSMVRKERLPTGVQVELLSPNQTTGESAVFQAMPAGYRMPGWQLALTWNDDNVINAAARGRIAAYMIVGLLSIAVASALALWIALRFLRQMRLTRLKNDLVATVSHELKTPLASIRLLVDTLLAANSSDPQQTREYLELIAKENARLSRLIDNFLTFSRMERNKRAFTFAEIEPAAVVASAVDAVRERFDQSGCRFDVQVEPDLPQINADADALTTAIVNLLDNAWKYTDADKHIILRAYRDADSVSLSVTDNGIGLSRVACKRVFERFYQVDRELSRTRGGCGLGLSIVEFIVQGHGGQVTVQSQPGRGSTFTITLPRMEQ